MHTQHQPVMLAEVLDYLQIQPDGIYVDATFGRGGHSAAILERLDADGKLLAIDKDLAAVGQAKTNSVFANDPRFNIVHADFNQLTELLTKHNWIGNVNGILLDLGVSSPQLDDAERGFSFMREGKLDMRMNREQTLTAKKWVNTTALEDMCRTFKTLGEERFSKRIASAIVKAREDKPIETTRQLAEIIAQANPRWEKHKHPATRVFQAIRLVVNKELDHLKDVLPQCANALKVGGRVLVISFHSLEDRIVKQFFQKMSRCDPSLSKVPFSKDQIPINFRIIAKKIKPTAEEIQENPRARSAILRVMEKIR